MINTKCPICDSLNLNEQYKIDHRNIVKCGECGECGFAFTKEFDRQSLAKAYQKDYYSSVDDPKIESWFNSNSGVWEGLVNFISKNTKKTINILLDVGAGYGGFLLTYNKRFPNVRLYATEQSAEARGFVNNKTDVVRFIDYELLDRNYVKICSLKNCLVILEIVCQ